MTDSGVSIVGEPALFVIDLQRGGAMGSEISGIGLMDGYLSVIKHAERLVEAARRSGVPVIFFQEQHRPSGVDIGRELDGSEGMHCVEGATGTELWPTLTPAENEYLIAKRRYSCFFGTELDILLRGLGTTTILLSGVLTDVCVQYTFADAHQRDFHVRVATDAVAGSSHERHLAALDSMSYLQREALVTSAAIEAAFSARGASNAPRLGDRAS